MPIIKTKEDLDRFVLGKLLSQSQQPKPTIMQNLKNKITGNNGVQK